MRTNSRVTDFENCNKNVEQDPKSIAANNKKKCALHFSPFKNAASRITCGRARWIAAMASSGV